MSEEASRLLACLIAQYDAISKEKEADPFPFSKTIGNESGTIYLRRMVLTGYLCLASIQFEERVRGEKVLGEFIRHVQQTPYLYKGISIELIHNKRLARHLQDDLRFCVQETTTICDEHAPTLFKAFP